MASGAFAQTQTPTERLTRLHDSMNLRADQEPAWRDYTAAITSNSESTARREATQRLLPQLPTPRRVALIDATMEQDLADLRRQGAAVITFYNHLTADQQSIFDRQTVPASAGQSVH
jgi:periplasmic protein CpxP/Spy